MKKYFLKAVAIIAQIAAFATVNSTCSLIIYEPDTPESAKKYIV